MPNIGHSGEQREIKCPADTAINQLLDNLAIL